MYDLNIRKKGYEIKGIVTRVYLSNEGKVGKHFIWYKYKINNEYITTRDNLVDIVFRTPYFKEKDRIPLLTNGKKAVINFKKIKKMSKQCSVPKKLD